MLKYNQRGRNACDPVSHVRRGAESSPADAGAVPVQGGGRGRAGHPRRAREELLPHQVRPYWIVPHQLRAPSGDDLEARV